MPVPASRSNVRVAPGNAPWARSEPPSSPFASPPPKSLPRNVLVARGAAPAAPAAAAPVEPSLPAERRGPLVRLRSLLVLGLIGAAVWLLHPRAQAAWKLHASATQLANYALCMVGPTGPALLRDNSPEFAALVRRRLISSEPAERPFQDCAKLAREITASEAAERAHRAPASSFVEYGGSRAGEVSLGALGITGHHLAELARAAWPFVRGGYVKLVKPSIAAHEAVHPIEPPRPGVGRGLPAWRAGYRAVGEVGGVLTAAFGKGAALSVYQSADGGLSWRSAPAKGVEAFAERCPAGARSFTFTLSADTKTLLVSSEGSDGPPQTAELAPADAELVSVSCDAKAMVVAYQKEHDKQVHLAACAHRGRCTAMPLPQLGGVDTTPGAALDLARVDGATIVSVPTGGVVRVASTRDDGQSWTPFTVAFDDKAHQEPRVDVRVPSRLLVIGKRVFLYGAAPKPGQSYSVIASDDLGASWRTPDVTTTPVAAR